MKHLKKLVAMLLVSVMALTMLTACGGGGSGSSSSKENQLTEAINKKLSSTGISLTYDDKLSDKATVYLQQLIVTGGDAEAAMKASGLDEENYYIVFLDVKESVSVDYAAGPLAVQIESVKSSWGVAKKIGYAEGELIGGGYRIFGLLQK